MATWGAGSARKAKLGARYAKAGISAPSLPLIKDDLFPVLLTPQRNLVRRRTATAQLLAL